MGIGGESSPHPNSSPRALLEHLSKDKNADGAFLDGEGSPRPSSSEQQMATGVVVGGRTRTSKEGDHATADQDGSPPRISAGNGGVLDLGDEAPQTAIDGYMALPRKKKRETRKTPYPFAPSQPTMIAMYGPPPAEEPSNKEFAFSALFDSGAERSLGAGGGAKAPPGPESYGGRVKRHPHTGGVTMFLGKPAYAGGGYPNIVHALLDTERLLKPVLQQYPELVNDQLTGGAQPLHMCSTTRATQYAVEVLCDHGADVEALDSQGVTPLQRMAWNDMLVGCRLLLLAGASPLNRGKIGFTPEQMATRAGAGSAKAILTDALNSPGWMQLARTDIERVQVIYGGHTEVQGNYWPRPASQVPIAFNVFCRLEGWHAETMWKKWNRSTWYKNEDNDSYIYRNAADGHWWIDSLHGVGLYSVAGPAHAPPAHGWTTLQESKTVVRAPMVRTYRKKKIKEIEIQRPPHRPAIKDL
ncbi:unnamed protein product [Amoebophrya sp. A25]|nr:unnamed protein product [Amoebophrya sp. A25]|eukprot:GSA25T00010007001.1